MVSIEAHLKFDCSIDLVEEHILKVIDIILFIFFWKHGLSGSISLKWKITFSSQIPIATSKNYFIPSFITFSNISKQQQHYQYLMSSGKR